MTFADLFTNDAEPLRNPDQGAGTSVLERPETKESPVRDDGGDADRFASWQAQYGDKADYINIIAWRQTAEFVAKHFAKGQRVAIVGSIQTRSWEDNDGGKHKAVEIVADSVYFADAKKESAAGSYAESAMTSEGFEVTDEDIPF